MISRSPGPLSLMPQKVQDTVYDDTVQFFFVGCPHLLGVGPHRVETDEEVARNHVTFAVIERE